MPDVLATAALPTAVSPATPPYTWSVTVATRSYRRPPGGNIRVVQPRVRIAASRDGLRLDRRAVRRTDRAKLLRDDAAYVVLDRQPVDHEKTVRRRGKLEGATVRPSIPREKVWARQGLRASPRGSRRVRRDWRRALSSRGAQSSTSRAGSPAPGGDRRRRRDAIPRSPKAYPDGADDESTMPTSRGVPGWCRPRPAMSPPDTDRRSEGFGCGGAAVQFAATARNVTGATTR